MKTKKINGKSNVIGQNIKKYRNFKGLSQRQLSNKLALLGVDIYPSDVSDIENQKLLIKDFEIIAICKVLNISYNQLFENMENLFN
ncbi:MAG: helix-turn-helix transcriptional regulator [Clostridia bacterium]|nr:helix-turn-helix transcriptional regulator [Clostridia bacterium]